MKNNRIDNIKIVLISMANSIYKDNKPILGLLNFIKYRNFPTKYISSKTNKPTSIFPQSKAYIDGGVFICNLSILKITLLVGNTLIYTKYLFLKIFRKKYLKKNYN